MPVIVIAVAGAATDFGGLPVEQRHNRVVGQPAALDAEIVNHVSKAIIAHFREYNTEAGNTR